jgi:aminotransferase
MLDISEYGYADDIAFCEDLARLVGIGAVPGSSFFKEDIRHLIRIHFAKKLDTLRAALDRLQDMRGKMGK